MTSRVGFRAVCTLIVMLLAAAGPTMAYQTEVQRYYESMKDICRTGVTPEMTAAWSQARLALDTARYGGGRDGSNFAGIKSPTDAWLDCFQSPGDGKE
jgi:hypothetical protein